MEEICRLFTFLGIFLAKCLQDNRLVDIPLSQAFFKMLCAGKGKYSRLSRTLSQSSEATSSEAATEEEDNSIDDLFEDSSSVASVEKLDSHYFSDVLTDVDFELIHPSKAKFVKQLESFIEKRDAILSDKNLSDVEQKNQLDELTFTTEHGHSCKLSDLGLSFQYIPSSTIYGFDSVELKTGGNDEMLTVDNADEYITLLKDFTMHRGIARQLEAFRAGFNRVFPMEKLHAFKPHEVQLMLCGEQAPKWTYEELMMYTEPKYGYHKDSPGFLRLLDVLVDMTGDERKDFLQFATGCSSLPPGGIANLHPRLTVVKKEGESDGSFPSVNTCVHYLKLPEYSSKEMLRSKLLSATKEKGFHLN
jgi:E3 ubiquitin-protein ligase HECTD1